MSKIKLKKGGKKIVEQYFVMELNDRKRQPIEEERVLVRMFYVNVLMLTVGVRMTDGCRAALQCW